MMRAGWGYIVRMMTGYPNKRVRTNFQSGAERTRDDSAPKIASKKKSEKSERPARNLKSKD